MASDSSLVQFPKKLDWIFQPHPYKVLYGGRGSTKSWSAARALLILGACTDIRCLCAREYQKSIKESVHQVLTDQIQALNLESYYKVLDREIRSRINGTSFIFEGLHANAHEIKSKEGLTHCWIEEAENISKSSWNYLEPTLRTQWVLPWQFCPPGTLFSEDEADLGGKLVDPEIWITFNPAEEGDFIYQYFVGGEHPKPDFKPPPGSKVVCINWTDNPWFPNNLRMQKDHLALTDPDGYLHIWEGKPRKQSAAQIMRGKYVVEDFTPADTWAGPYHGTDFGFATDPTASIKCWVDEAHRRLMIEYEAFEYHTETDDVPGLISTIPDSEKYVNRADNARPETISYCRRHGHPRMIACEKWPGSVEDGVTYLRQEFHQIVIHPRCAHTLEEMKLYSYKVDKNTGDVLPEIEDKNNHCIDALRYSIGPLIKGQLKFTGVWWRRWTDLQSFEQYLTLRMVTVTVDEVSDGSGELNAVFHLYGLRGASALYLLRDDSCFGLLPNILKQIDAFYKDCSGATELWMDAKSVGPTLLKGLRRLQVPAREWLPREKRGQDTPDMTVMDPAYRAKLASVPLSEGRIFVPEGACSVVSEIEGLHTNAMTLAVLIWQQRGGGVGAVPE